MKLKNTKEHKDYNNNAMKLHEAKFSKNFKEQSQALLKTF